MACTEHSEREAEEERLGCDGVGVERCMLDLIAPPYTSFVSTLVHIFAFILIMNSLSGFTVKWGKERAGVILSYLD